MYSSFRSFSIFTLIILFALSAAAFADTIRLKDGSVVKGRIVTFTGGKFVVAVGDGDRRKEMTFTADEVDSIRFDSGQARQAASVAAAERPLSNASYEPPVQPVRPAPKVVLTNTLPPAPVKAAKASVETKPAAAAQPRASNVKPIEIMVAVLADNTANGWTNSGWVVKKGQKIRVTGDGEISLGGGRTTGPAGSYEIDDSAKLLKSVPTGALIAVVGDDNNDFIYIGSSREFTATRDGALFFGVNEGNLNDNSGKFSVKVEIDPVSGG